MADLARFGHDANPARDFVIEVGAILVMERNRGDGPVGEQLCARVSAAMEFRVGGDRDAIAAKGRLRQVADAIRAELGTRAGVYGPDTFQITAPNGAIYYLKLEGDDLRVHVEPAPGKRVRVHYESDTGNEGWLRLDQRVALRAALPVRSRAVA